MRRREFITLVGGAAAAWPLAAAAWPLAARAQQSERMRRIGVFTPLTADDPEVQARIAAFLQGLQELGWTVGRNVRVDYRFGGGDPEHLRGYAAELVADAPDVILAIGAPAVAALLQASQAIPVVFANVIDPVGAGFVASLARPGRNATGFTLFEYGISGKWLELLKEIAPGVRRAAVLRDSNSPTGVGQWAIIQAAASSFGVEVSPIDVREAGEIERALMAFAREPNSGVIVTPSGTAIIQRKLIITLAAQHHLPATYPFRFFADSGGLMSYGPDTIDPSRRAATYVDRILRGEKPADLPVQSPTKYELVVNMKTAKALGLDVPPTLLARANGLIE